MSTVTIPQLPNSNDLDPNDYLIVYNTETNPDVLTYKGRISDVLNLIKFSVNGKTGTTITLTPDDLSDATSLNKFVTASDKTRIAIIRNDQGSGTFLSGDGTYKAISNSTIGNNNYTVNTIADRDLLTGLNNGDRVLVLDASGDVSVGSGSALYFWNSSTGTYVLIADSINLTIDFNQNYTGATPSTESIGGITVGYQLTGKTANQILEQMLIVPPSTNPFVNSSFFISTMDIPLSSTTYSRYDLVNTPVISVGIPLSGRKLFSWGVVQPQNVKQNSIAVKDVTNNTYIASGLTFNNYNGYNMGYANVDIGTIPNTSAMTHTWRIEGTNIYNQTFQSSEITITSV